MVQQPYESLPEPFERYSGNPILGPTGEGWEAKDVFNPAAWTDGETVYLLYRAEDREGVPGREFTSRLCIATGNRLAEWVKWGPLFPERGWTKSGAILDHLINGRYWMYFGDTNIWAAHSTDLRQ